VFSIHDSAAIIQRRNRPILILILCGALLIAAIAVGTLIIVDNFRQRALAESERELKNTALILAEQIDRSFQAIELVQTSVVAKIQSLEISSSEDLTRQMSGQDVHLMLKTSINGLAQVDAITLINADGTLLNSSRGWPIPAANLADRDYYKALKSDAQLTSFISLPVRNRITGAWTLFLARKLKAPNGEFLGVILGATELSYFEKFFGAIELEGHGSIALLRSDGVMLVRYPLVESYIGRTFRSAIKALGDSNGGTIRYVVDEPNGKDRLLAAHRLTNYPMHLSVAIDIDAALADWRSETKVLLSAAGLAVLTIALMTLLIVRQLSRSHKLAEDKLRRAKVFLDAVIENVPMPIVVKTANDFRFILINKASEELFGIKRDVVIGKTLRETYSQERAERIEMQDRKCIDSDQPLISHDYHIPTQKGDRLVYSNKVMIPGADGKPEYLLTLFDDVTERRESEKRIAHMAHSDPLTDLPNRTAFNEYLALTLRLADVERRSFAILCMDLDGFKDINDVYGHAVGDLLLCRVADRLRAVAGGVFIARLGGDEFTIIADSGWDGSGVGHLAARLLAAFVDDFEITGQRLRQALSIGIAIFPVDGKDAKTLINNADAALYCAKAEDRNSFKFFEAEMGLRLRERAALQTELRSAIQRNELRLHYQPQLKMTGEITGFEALARWHSPKRGMVPPSEFIPLAEESNLILSIGEWVLRDACREAARWEKPLRIAINVSPIQFRHGDLPRLVHTVLLETGLAPGRLEIEITEGVLIDDFSRAVSILRKLKSLGVQIALDDFGTGYSSLSYLHSFPFDKIKIDRTFISELESNRHSIAIVRAVIGLCRSLNIPVLAEGVENKAQHTFLAQEGCNEVQGYLTGRPLAIEDYASVIGRKKIAATHSLAS
jgi:diguanylate cyclase (GGDEF)-like protein/PAS domain S-box-containing protein